MNKAVLPQSLVTLNSSRPLCSHAPLKKSHQFCGHSPQNDIKSPTLWLNSRQHSNITGIFTHVRSGDGVVRIATRYGLKGPGIESRWRRDFPHLSWPAPGPTQPPVQLVKAALTTHPHLVPRSTERNRDIPLLSLKAFAAYKRVKPYLYLHMRHTRQTLKM